MRAMVLSASGGPLELQDTPIPEPESGQVLVRVSCCGICRTDLHILDGELDSPVLPLIPGHQVVGTIESLGKGVQDLLPGQRIGVPWLGYSCGHCEYCMEGSENLCGEARYTGYQINGGFAEYCVADVRYCFPIPEGYPDLQAAPLLCAGLIGYRSLKAAGDGRRLGFYGFGSAAHILCQLAVYQQREVYAFTRPDDLAAMEFAQSLGAVWAGSSKDVPPAELDAAIIFAPDGSLVPTALQAVRRGGRVVCAGIHMSDIPQFPYRNLWEERSIRSVANLTRTDGLEFLELAPRIPIRTEVTSYPLDQANQALDDLRLGKFSGSAVITI